MKTLRVLIIEDEATSAMLLKRRLSRLAGEIVVASTWKDAVNLLGTKPPFDVITVDLVMPNPLAQGEIDHIEEGIERVAEVRRAAPNSIIHVVSGHVDDTVTKRSIEKGADAVVPKPEAFIGPTLYERLMYSLETHGATKENIALAREIAERMRE